MAKSVIIDELIVTVRVPASMPDNEAAVIRQVSLGAAFTAAVRDAVRVAVRTAPELVRVRVSVSR